MQSDTNTTTGSSTRTGQGASSSTSSTDLRGAMQSAASTVSGLAQQATDQMREQGSSLASEATERVRGLLDGQISSGADLVEQIARSARHLADDLDGTAPQLAGMVRSAAESAESFSSDIRDKSVDELVEVTSDFARRQPALFVGAAVAAGFMMARFVKASARGGSFTSGRSSTSRGNSTSNPSYKSSHGRTSSGQFHDA